MLGEASNTSYKLASLTAVTTGSLTSSENCSDLRKTMQPPFTGSVLDLRILILVPKLLFVLLPFQPNRSLI